MQTEKERILRGIAAAVGILFRGQWQVAEGSPSSTGHAEPPQVAGSSPEEAVCPFIFEDSKLEPFESRYLEPFPK